MTRHLFIERKTKRFSIVKKAALALFVSLAFFACDGAGLGESIDTIAPVVTVTGPESSAVLSGAFKVEGTCFDDKGIANVIVTVTNTGSGEQVGVYAATLGLNSWSLELNQPQDGKYPMADGTYSASAVCFDAAGRQSGAASRVFEVDNTAPVFCITSPNSLNIDDPAAFGRSVKIKGEIADDHAIKQMDIRVFKYSGGSINEITSSMAKTSFSGFETAGGTEVKIAQYYPDGQAPASDSDEYPLYQNYMAMYSGATVGDTVKFYIFPFLTDIAGNTSGNCYIQTQLKKLVSEACGVETTSDSLQTAQFKKMLNGSYSLGEVDVEKVKQILNGSYAQSSYSYLARMGKDDAGIDASNAALAMSVNANNAPMYEFGGFAVDQTSAGASLTEAAPGGQISVRVSAGLDGTLVKPSSLKVYLWECDATLALLPGQDIKNPDTAKYSSAKGQFTITTDGTTDISTVTESVATGTYVVTLPMTILGGSRYRVTAAGEDDDGNELDSDNFYAFMTTLSANAPSVKYDDMFFIKAGAISAPQEGLAAVPFYTAQITIEDKIQKTMDQAGEIKITPLLYKGHYAAITDLKEGDYLKTPDWAGNQMTIGHDKITDVSSGNGTYQASLDMNIFPLTIYPADNYTVALKIVASNDVASSGEDIFLFWADNKKPALAMTSPSASNMNIYDTDKDCAQEKDSGGVPTGKYTYTPRGTWSDINGSGTSRLWWSTTDATAPTFTYAPVRAPGDTTDHYGDGSTVYYEQKAADLTDPATGAVTVKSDAYTCLGVLGTNDKVNDYYTLSVTGGTWTEAAGVSQTAAETQWSAAIAGLEESVGQKISVIAIDAAGNVSDIQTASGLTYDFSLPTVEFVSEPGGSNPAKAQTYYNGGTLKFGFKVEDTLAVSSGVPIVVTAKKSGASVTSGYRIVDIVPAADNKSATAAIELASDGTSDGKWSFEVSAKDACGRVGKSTTVATVVDCKKPELKNYDYDPATGSAGTKPIVIKGSGTLDDWYKDEALEISGKFLEAESGSGIDKIYYFLETPTMQKNASTAPYTIPEDLINPGPTPAAVVTDHIDYKTFAGDVGTQIYKITPIGFEQIETSAGTSGPVTHYNNLYIQAIDKAGNKSARVGPYQIQEDQTNPSASAAFYTYDGNVLTTAAGSVMTNAQNAMTLYGAASDGLSGLNSISFKIGETAIAASNVTILYSTVARSSEADYKNETTEEYKYKALSALDKKAVKSWKAVIAKDALASGDFYVVADDLAGNVAGQNQKAFALVVDKTPPEITIASHSNGDKIYGEVTFKGTASDGSGLASVAVDYSIDNTSWTTLYSTTEDSAMYNWSADAKGAKAISAVADSGTTYKMLGYSALYAGTTKPLYIRFTAADKAGNSGSKTYTFTIDPELDRPKIAVANAVLDSMTSSAPVWVVGAGNNKIYGTVDDDKVTALSATFKYYDKNATGDNKWIDLTASTTPAAPTVAFANGSFTISGFPDGKNIVTFAATKNEKTYAAHAAGVDNYIAPLLCGSGENPTIFGKKKGDSLLYVTVDTAAPVLGQKTFYVYSKETGAYGAGSSTLPKLGGDRSKFKCEVSATDTNGVEKISLKIRNAKNKAGQDINIEDSKVLEDGQETAVLNVDISALASGTYTYEIVATDKAGLESVFTNPISVDTTPPNVTVSVPSKENEVVMGVLTNVSGSTNEFGTTPMLGGADRAKVYYALCPIAKSDAVPTLPASFSKWYNVDTGAYVDITPVAKGTKGFDYEQFKDAGVSWNVIFDGDTDSSDGTHAKKLNDFIADYGIASAEAIATSDLNKQFGSIVRMYVWIKVVDEVGNVTEISHGVNVDPQGDRPKVSFTYPEEHGKTVSGKVSLTGDIIDPFNSNPKEKDTAWIQIIADQTKAPPIHGSYNYEPGADPTGFKLGPADVYKWVSAQDGSGNPLYEVYDIANYKIGQSNTPLAAGAFTVTTDSEGNVTRCVFNSVSATDEDAQKAEAAKYGIFAKFDGNTWGLDINSSSEFSDDERPIEVAIRAYAFNGKFSSPVYRVMTFNKDAPDISDFYLRQYSGSTVTASRAYVNNIYVRDKNENDEADDWYITFTLTDSNDISYVCFSNTSVADAKQKIGPGAEIQKYIADGDCSVVSEQVGDKTLKHYKLRHKLTRSATSEKETLYVYFENKKDPVGSGHYTFVVNHDNQKPVLAESGHKNFNISQTVCNSDLWYTLGSMAREDGNDQSGFARVVFYFKRDISVGADQGKSKIYDPMYSKGWKDGGTKDITYTLSSDAVLKDGLYWKAQTVKVNGAELALGSKVPSVHVGGIVKFEGMIYTINSLSDDGKTVTIDSSTEHTGTEYDKVTAYFALGNVVDNKNIEAADKDFKSNMNWTQGYGYGYGTLHLSGNKSHDADDGDRMIERAVTTGSQTVWEACINSKNIPDGPIEICYTVYDIAGNYTYGSVTGANVSNNAPRIANITVGTDYNGNGAIEAAESLTWFADDKKPGSWDKAMTAITLHGGNKDAKDTDPDFTTDYLTAKGMTVIQPEILGGNGDLYYYYSYPSAASATTYVTGYNKNVFMASNADREAQKASQTGSITMQVGDLMKAWKGSGKYEFKIYDSTEETIGVPDVGGTVTEPTSQHADITLYMNNQVNDTTEPTDSKITPFYWNSVTDNSIYDSSEAEDASYLKGHIELPKDLKTTSEWTSPFTDASGEMDQDPKVSGKIVLRGEAFDAVRLDSLYITLPGFTGFDGVPTITKDAKTFYKMAAFDAAHTAWKYGDGTAAAPVDFATNGWSFKVESSEFDDAGHKVTWSLALDTSKHSATAATDVLLEFISKDQGVPTCPETGTVANGLDGVTKYAATQFNAGKTSSYDHATTEAWLQMDIVPYVARIYTELGSAKKSNWSVFNRTTSGSYPVYTYLNSASSEGGTMTAGASESVQVYGFNLKGASGLSNLAAGDTRQDSSEDYDCYKYAAGALSGSGVQAVEFAVNGIKTLNNVNNNDAKGDYTKTTSVAAGDYEVYANYYNRLPNGSNNNTLADDIKFEVWQLNDSAAVPISNKIVDPVMKINPKSGIIGFAFENDPTYFSMPNGVSNSNYGERSYEYWAGCYDKITVPAFDYIYSATDQGEVVALAQGNDISGDNADNFMFYYSKWDYNHDGHNVAATGQQINGYGLEQIGYSYDSKKYWDKSRFQATSVVSAEKRVYLAYYDRVSSQIRFRSSLKKDVPNAIGDRNTVVDFGNIISRNKRQTAHGIPTWSNPVANAQIFAAAKCSMSTYETTYKPGQHLCLAARAGAGDDSDDLVAIVWHDGTDCYYSVNKTPGTSRATNLNKFDGSTGWSKPTQVFSGAGQYCKLAFDQNGGVHIAAYDSNNNRVRYAYKGATDSTFKTCNVNSNDAGGAYLTLDVSLDGTAPVPQIGYYSSACAKPMLAKYAGPNLTTDAASSTTIAGVASDGSCMTGAWEISAVPSASVISKDRVNVALRKDSSGAATAPAAISATQQSYYVNTPAGYGSDSYGVVYGLNNTNAVMGYCRAEGAKTYIETAQKK